MTDVVTDNDLLTCDVCGHQVKTPQGMRAHKTVKHPEPVEESTETFHVEPDGETTEQPAPKRQKRRLGSLRDRLSRKSGEPEPVDLGGEKPPRKWGTKPERKGKRTSLAELISTGYSLAGGALAKGPQYPVGRALQFQAPFVGPEIDSMVKGTVVDNLLQPVARIVTAGEKASKVGGFPALVGGYHNFPSMRPYLEKPLASAIRANVVEMAKEARRLKEIDRKLQAEFVEAIPILWPDGLRGADGETTEALPDDIVAAIMVDLFAPPMTTEGGPSGNGSSSAPADVAESPAPGG